MEETTKHNNDLPPETEREKAARLIREDEAEKLQRRKDLGARGKLWTIDAWYRQDKTPIQITRGNLTWEECMTFRETVYTHGLLIQLDTRKWRVIHPCDIIDIHLLNQLKYYD